MSETASPIQKTTRRTARTERANLRLTKESKVVINAAARLRNKNFSQYVIKTAVEQARKDLATANPLDLPKEDRLAIVQLLSQPATPNKKLATLFERFLPDQGSERADH